MRERYFVTLDRDGKADSIFRSLENGSLTLEFLGVGRWVEDADLFAEYTGESPGAREVSAAEARQAANALGWSWPAG